MNCVRLFSAIYIAIANKSRKITVRAEASPRIPFKSMLGTFIRDSFVVSRIHQELFRKAVYLRRSLKRVWPAFSMLGPGERKEWFLKRNPLLLPQELWNNIVARITEDAFVRPYVALFSANCAAKSRKILRPLLWNRALLEHYWKLSEEKMNNRRGRD